MKKRVVMFGQTNDLQQAIDQVNNNDAGTNDAAGDFSAIQDQLGVPPMPPTDGVGVPPMPGAPTDTTTPAEGPEATAPEADSAAPIAPVEPAPITTPEASADASVEPKTEEATPFAEDKPAAEPAPVDAVSTDTAPQVSAIEVTEVATETPAAEDGDIAKIRENVLKDLMPLMDKVQSEPEQKFEIYKDAMETLHDKGLVSGAYKVASQITDENKKAESLIELMKAIDTLE